MTISYRDLSDMLTENNIRPSHQRVKVLEYLVNNECHPSAEDIYISLLEDMPTLSRSTVYNSLTALASSGLVRTIDIDESELRYDAMIQTHGHFRCERCGAIYNFEIDIDSYKPKELDNFRIDDKNVYFKGICDTCLKEKNGKEGCICKKKENAR